MKYEVLFRSLLRQLRYRIPQNSKLVTKLVDILELERMAIYRRLRQEVQFSFEEIVAIAKEFNFSLDSIHGVDAGTIFLFRVQSHKNKDTVEIDYSKLNEYIQAINEVASDLSGELSLVSNLLPFPLYTGFKFIYHFYYFKWRFYSVPPNQTKAYHEIIFPERLTQILEDIFTYSKIIKNNSYVFDNRVFQDFVNDVAYFNSIRLISDEDVLHIKDDLFRFLDFIEAAATTGFVDNPLNKVSIYISDTCIDTSFSCVCSQSISRFGLTWSFIYTFILVFEEENLEMMKQRIRSIKRTSTLLSGNGEKQRTLYFETQRKIVEQL